MKQILQNLKTGATEVAEVPCPGPRPGHVLIRTFATVVSPGTERMLVEFGKAGWIDKARQQPDKVRQVLDKVRTDGLATTLEAVQSKLDQPVALGYCNVGIVEQKAGDGAATGKTGKEISPGERVVSNGAHAEVVCVPRNLCARVPDGVSDEEAAFTVLGAIGLQGVRLAAPMLGECFAVTGLGLIGLMTVQILRANGCRVLGIDPDSGKCALARKFGAETVDLAKGEDAVAVALAFSRGNGVDGVLITAATESSEPVHQAALMCRRRGRIVLVGVTGLELSRDDFYEKELSFQVSCSYGPGRYDPGYEEKGHDYPIGYVRWTEQRNIEAVLDLMAAGRLDVKPLISHRFSIQEAGKAYALLQSGEAHLGILLEYPRVENLDRKVVALVMADRGAGPGHAAEGAAKRSADAATVGCIGAGNYAGRFLIPAFKKAGARLQVLAGSGGVHAVHFGRKYGFAEAATDVSRIMGHTQINTVIVATRHDTHARFVLESLRNGKHVFVEKPLCMSLQELEEIRDVFRAASPGGPILMVGFNRRFSSLALRMKALLDAEHCPKSFVMTVNAGAVPASHWTQDPAVGGGRILGEACHFIDLLRFLAGCKIVSASRLGMRSESGDTASLQLGFADGSIGTIHYFANGSPAFPKERLEVFSAGRVLALDNFRSLKGYGWKGLRTTSLWRQDKGREACAAAMVEAVRRGETAVIPPEELFEVARVTLELANS